MRLAALPLLVAATGCNWVFGLNPTQMIDAAPDAPDAPDAAIVRMVFERQVGTTDTNGMAIPGMPVAISPAPAIQLGAMGDMLQSSDYDATSRTFVVPSNLPGNPWRLVYTADGDPTPTEIQWTANSAHLVLPWLARPGDMAPPAGSGWDFKVQGSNPAIGAPRVMTSGAFTETIVDSGDFAGPAEIKYHYAQFAKGIFGPVGTPTVAQGDWALLYDYRFLAGGSQTVYGANGYAWVQADLTSGALTTVTPPWVTTTTAVSGINWADAVNSPRLNQVSTLGNVCCRYHLEYGILPSPYIAPFVPSPTGVDTTSLVQLYVDDDTGEPISISVNDPPSTDVKLPRMLLAGYQASRTAYGVTLTNTIQTLGTAKTLTFAAPLAESVTFGGMTLMTGSADNQSIMGSTSTITLKWTAEASSPSITLGADDWVVTLYEISAAGLAPIRRYQVLQPRVEVDGKLMLSGHRYVFGITSRAGFPNAPQADYSMVTLPFSETTVFPLAFVIQ